MTSAHTPNEISAHSNRASGSRTDGYSRGSDADEAAPPPQPCGASLPPTVRDQAGRTGMGGALASARPRQACVLSSSIRAIAEPVVAGHAEPTHAASDLVDEWRMSERGSQSFYGLRQFADHLSAHRETARRRFHRDDLGAVASDAFSASQASRFRPFSRGGMSVRAKGRSRSPAPPAAQHAAGCSQHRRPLLVGPCSSRLRQPAR